VLSKVINGHNFEIDFTYDGAGIDTVTLQCHTCDKAGKDILVLAVEDGDTIQALTNLNDFAEWHVEIFSEES
jgi:hypothetical protein